MGIFILFSVTNNIYGVNLTQHVMMWLLRLLFLTQQEVLMISSRVSCSNGGAFREGDGVYVGPEGTDDPVLDLVKEHPASVTFIGFPDFITAENKVGVAVNGVFPSIDSISAGLYDILGRQIFMRVRSSKAESAVPYVMDGLLGPTVDGFVPLSDNQTQAMLDRLATL